MPDTRKQLLDGLADARTVYLREARAYQQAAAAVGAAHVRLAEAHVSATDRATVIVAARDSARADDDFNRACDRMDRAYTTWLEYAAEMEVTRG